MQAAISNKPDKETTPKEPLSFHWGYIVLPLSVLLLSILLTAYFYHLLPPEVAYHFKLDVTPDKWLGRETTVVWMLVPQFFLTLLAGGITWGITKLRILPARADGAWIKPQMILMLMGNMIGLPQIILCFAMLDIFSYNSYQIHIIPMRIFLLIILGLAGIALGVFSVLTILKTKQQPISQPDQRNEEDQ